MLVSRYRPCCRLDGYKEFNKDKGDRMYAVPVFVVESGLTFCLQSVVWRRFVGWLPRWSVLLGADWVIGGRSKDGTMQVKDQDYTHGNRALQVCSFSCECPFLMSLRKRCSWTSLFVLSGYRLHSKYTPNNGYARPLHNND